MLSARCTCLHKEFGHGLLVNAFVTQINEKFTKLRVHYQHSCVEKTYANLKVCIKLNEASSIFIALLIEFSFLFYNLGETTNVGASSGGSGAGTPDRNIRSRTGSTPEHGSSSHGQSEVDGQFSGAGMFGDSLVNSVLPAAHSRELPPMSDRWQQRGR